MSGNSWRILLEFPKIGKQDLHGSEGSVGRKRGMVKVAALLHVAVNHEKLYEQNRGS